MGEIAGIILKIWVIILLIGVVALIAIFITAWFLLRNKYVPKGWKEKC